jgi:NAD(P)-dependent dehydrogenase (short-subunit alcohol dehydrogenase family)
MVFGFDESPSLQSHENFFFIQGDISSPDHLDLLRGHIHQLIEQGGMLRGVLNATWAKESDLSKRWTIEKNPNVDLPGPTRDRAILETVMDLSSEQLAHEISDNVAGAHNCIRALWDFILTSGDCSVVHYSSQYAAKVPNQDLFTHRGKFVMKLPGYSMSKVCLETYSKYLASVFGPLGPRDGTGSLRFNCIAPGNLQQSHSENFIKRYEENTWLIGMAQITDITKITLFMLSSDSRYITGTTIYVDGGWSTK